MPNRQELDSKLTPAAKQALDELVADYRDQLLLGAADSASRLGELHEISVHDIMAGLNRQQDRLFGRTASNVERILRLYVVGGFLLGVTGLVAFSVREILSGSGFQEQLFLLTAMGGLLLAAMSYFLLWTRKSRRTAYLHRRQSVEFRSGTDEFRDPWRDPGSRTNRGRHVDPRSHAAPESVRSRPVAEDERDRAYVRLRSGRVRLAELHWYEAHGIGKKDFKRKRYLD